MRYSKLKQEEINDERKARTMVLKSDDPFILVEVGGIEDELWQVMEDIYQYIKHVFNMNDNPLRHLRKCFPDFKWEFHKVAGLEKLAPIIANADYIWSTYEDIFFSEGIITAIETGRSNPRAFLYRHESEQFRLMQLKENIKLRSFFANIQFVYNDFRLGTVIK